MKYNVYSVLDSCSGYGVPIIQDNDAVAMRSFENGCFDRNSVWFTHCADFSLMRVGSFDTSTGLLVAEDPVRLVTAFDIVNSMKGVKNNDEI